MELVYFFFLLLLGVRTINAKHDTTETVMAEVPGGAMTVSLEV